MLTLLVFLWGLISLLVDPWRPFGAPNLLQLVSCGALLVYFLRTWTRPRRRVAEAVATIVIGYTLLLTPWIAVMWCQLGRPMDAFTLPQVAAISMALVFPGRWWLGVTAMGLFAAESLFVFVYARYLGLDALIPITEPLGTFCFAALGIGLFMVRRRRRDLSRQHVRVQGEIQALDRVRPRFARAREELEAQVKIIAAEVVVNGTGGADQRSSSLGRALDRLRDLRSKLVGLTAGAEGSSSPPEAERRLLDHDAQLGAILLAGIGAALALPATLWIRMQLGDAPFPMFVPLLGVYGAMLIYLVLTRRRPSSKRALWAVLALYASMLPVIDYNQYVLLLEGRPFAPFLGHKLIMCILGLTLATRFKLGVVLIVVTAANAITLWFVLDLGAHRDLIALGEPVTTLLFMLIGIASLRMLEQREIASVQLLRAEAEASAMHRRALLFLALRDRLNSPLQTLVLGAERATFHLPASRSERVQVAVDRLVHLSQELAELDEMIPHASATLDADHELRRHL